MPTDTEHFWNRPGFDPRTAAELQGEHDSGYLCGISGMICQKCGAISDEPDRGDPNCQHDWA